MYPFRLACATRCFLQPIAESIRSAAELKVQGLQFDIRNELKASELTPTGCRDFLHRIDEHGLKVAGAVFPLNFPLYEPDRVDVRVAAIRDALKFAYAIGAPTLCIRVGQVPEDATSKTRELLVEVLCDLARHANHIGTALAISPTNDSATTLLSLMDEVKTGPIGIDFDPAQFVMTGRPVAESLRTLHNFVMHLQLRDGSSGIDGGQEEPVGQGNVDWVEILALLGETGYRGWMTSIRTQGMDRGLEMARGVKLVQRILVGG